MAFKIQEFHFGFADMENREKRKIYSVSHDMCRRHLASGYPNGDGRLGVEQSV